MTHEEIEGYRKRLVEILNRKKQNGNYEPSVKGDLQALALEVGASTQTVFLNVVQGGGRLVRDAEISELAYNIHQALQTASMANMCTTATEGYKIAKYAITKAACISIIAAVISLFSMLAAWAAVAVNLISAKGP